MKNYIDPTAIDLSLPWEAVDIEAIWPELFKIIDGSAFLIGLLEACVADWLRENPEVRPHRRRWKYGPEAYPPFLMTTHDGAESHVEDEIDAALIEGDEDAHLHHAIVTVLCSDELPDLSKSARRALRMKMVEIERRFAPQRETDPRWWRPMGSCMFLAPFWLHVAQKWRPDLEWGVVEGDHHHTVVSSGAASLIFDPLFLREKGDHLLEPLFFAVDDPRSDARRRIRECDALNRELQEKFAAERDAKEEAVA